ncbi:MAG TPA: glycosyltransferase [Frankiaceae bacterium]|nr:glycosyltransferase [Frankiaceae bacterium]
MALVSVLMPAYNHERWVAGAVESVLAQTHADVELLVVDDGCTDHTPQVLGTFADPRVRLLTHPGRANRGLHASLRLAAETAQGEWLSFLASDDAWEPHRLERLLAAGADAAYSQAALMDESDVPTGVVWGAPPDDDLFGNLLVTNVVPAATVLVTREVFDRAGGVSDERFEDLDLMLRVSALTDVAYVPEPLARYRVNTTGIAAQVQAEGRTRAEYASAIEHVASWPGLPEHRRATARNAAEAWTYVLSGDAPPPALQPLVARIEAAWAAPARPGLLARARGLLRRR